MKLPSISQIWADYNHTLRRFPLTMLSALVCAVVSIVLVEQEKTIGPSILYGILLTTILALPLLTALKVAAERESANPGRGWILQAVGVALIVVYPLTVPADLPQAPMVYIFRFFALAVAAFLLLSYLPFRHQGESIGFWHYNKILVFRGILAGAFTIVLFSGLGLALAALDNLFGIDVPPERYFELWIMILLLFAVPFILSGIPRKLAELEQTTDYPKSLKVFGQYVLSPLVLVYALILFAYIGKIIITWSWPQGWVGRLILGFSATGILALFVLDPIREILETKWLKRAARWYYLILLPLVVVLFLALWRRISEYGLTEDRCLGLAIGVWLAFAAGYFLLSRAKSIKMIPASLCVLTLLISVGPWSMFSISEQSQVERLRAMLVTDSILVDGVIQEASVPVSEEHEVEISGVLRYLHDIHGYSAIEPWFGESLREDDSANWFKSPADVAALLGVDYHLYRGVEMDKTFSAVIDPQASVPISGYDQMVRAGYGGLATYGRSGNQPANGKFDVAADSTSVSFPVAGVPGDSIIILLQQLFDQIASVRTGDYQREIPVDLATLEDETGEFRTKTLMLEGYFKWVDSTLVPTAYDLLILYSRKSEK